MENRVPARLELRKFAFLMTGAFSVLGAILLLKSSHKAPVIFFSLAGLFLITGLIAPRALSPVYRAWMRVAHALAWINTRVLLIFLYYVMFTLVGLIMRLVRRDILKRRVNRSTKSYWHELGGKELKADRYEHLY